MLRGNRNIILKVVSEDEYVQANIHKQSEELLRPWSTTYKALARGECATVDTLLKKLLGRELKTMEETLIWFGRLT